VATAVASKLVKLTSIGIVRGELVEPLNPSLKIADENRMHLKFVTR